MKKVKHIGEGYHGYDASEDRLIFVKPGEIIDVSDGKAEQLFSDFGSQWVLVEPKEEVRQPMGKGKK